MKKCARQYPMYQSVRETVLTSCGIPSRMSFATKKRQEPIHGIMRTLESILGPDCYCSSTNYPSTPDVTVTPGTTPTQIITHQRTHQLFPGTTPTQITTHQRPINMIFLEPHQRKSQPTEGPISFFPWNHTDTSHDPSKAR